MVRGVVQAGADDELVVEEELSVDNELVVEDDELDVEDEGSIEDEELDAEDVLDDDVLDGLFE